MIIKYLEVVDNESAAAENDLFIEVYALAGETNSENTAVTVLGTCTLALLDNNLFGLSQEEYDRLYGLATGAEQDSDSEDSETESEAEVEAKKPYASGPQRNQSLPNPLSSSTRPRRRNATFFSGR